jgi:hypothetical protein
LYCPSSIATVGFWSFPLLFVKVALHFKHIIPRQISYILLSVTKMYLFGNAFRDTHYTKFLMHKFDDRSCISSEIWSIKSIEFQFSNRELIALCKFIKNHSKWWFELMMILNC